MSFNKLSYDKCEINQGDIQRIDSMNYHLFEPKYSHHSFCNTPNNVCHLQSSNRTDIENALKQLNTKSSKCSLNKYQPPCPNAGNCSLPNNNFTPVRTYERDIWKSNITKPLNNGLPPFNL